MYKQELPQLITRIRSRLIRESRITLSRLHEFILINVRFNVPVVFSCVLQSIYYKSTSTHDTPYCNTLNLSLNTLDIVRKRIFTCRNKNKIMELVSADDNNKDVKCHKYVKHVPNLLKIIGIDCQNIVSDTVVNLGVGARRPAPSP